MKKLDLTLLPPDAWRPINSASSRSSNRTSERELEKIRAWVSLAESGENSNRVSVKICDYSSVGFAVLKEVNPNGSTEFREGDKVVISIDLGDSQLDATCIVQNSVVFRNGLRLGLSRIDIAGNQVGFGPRKAPKGAYFRLGKDESISAEIENPLLFGEWSQLWLCGIRTGMCFDFLSLDPSLALFIGQKMEVWLALPTSEKTSYSGKIIGLEKINNKTLRVRVEPVSISANITNDLAEILAFQFKVTPETLRSLDFPIRIFRNRLQFRFVENMQDYCAVLELRKNAYVEVGKRDLSTTAEQMSIEWDNTSRILCAFHEQKLVASAALTFPSHQSFVLRTEAVFPGGKFPEPHPNKLELLEINCLCTQKDYRKGDLLHALFEHIARIFVLSNRKYIMNLSDSHLLPMYLGIGFENMHQKGIFLGKEHHLIRGSRDGVVIGKGLRLLHWCMLYGDLVEELLSKDLIALSKWERIIVKSKLAFKPIAKRLARLKREKDFQKNVLARIRIDI